MRRRDAQTLRGGCAVAAMACTFGCPKPNVSEPDAVAQRSSRETYGVPALQGRVVSLDAAAAQSPIMTPGDGSAREACHECRSDAGPPAAASRPKAHEPGDCKATRARIEVALKRAARCDAHAQCAMADVHHALGPCGIALRKDAPLAALREAAAKYAARCSPPPVLVRCAHKTGALCTHQHCTLAAPDELEAAGVEAARIGF